ncbi:hypothetical protein CRG98_050344 [Punica granatum]|uniref:Uncharacterized protein n=1 Tax=Punica granatum TaxID=22663 RepID=A0A2I0GER9_PUNGR|nr:hypothetical protein CRG98_050344 [Punica granatum]
MRVSHREQQKDPKIDPNGSLGCRGYSDRSGWLFHAGLVALDSQETEDRAYRCLEVCKHLNQPVRSCKFRYRKENRRNRLDLPVSIETTSKVAPGVTSSRHGTGPLNSQGIAGRGHGRLVVCQDSSKPENSKKNR